MKKINKASYLKYVKNIKLINLKSLISLNKKILTSNFNQRLCLHKNVKDTHQEMVIIQHKNNFFPPKKNTKSDQTFFILKGKLLILIFNSKGKILSRTILSKKNNLLIRVKKNTYHCDIPLTKIAIHLETKNCKFDKSTNKLAKFKFDYKIK